MRNLTIVLAIAMAATAVHAGPDTMAKPCDLNADGKIGSMGADGGIAGPMMEDVSVMVGSYGKKRGEPGFAEAADLDENGTVTASDWGIYTRWCVPR